MTIQIRIVIRRLQAFCGCSHTNDSSIFLFEFRCLNRNIEESSSFYPIHRNSNRNIEESSSFYPIHRNSNRNIEESFVCERGVGSITIVLFSFEKSQIWSMQALAEECGE